MTSSGYNKDLMRIQNKNFLKNGHVNALTGIKIVEKANYIFNTTILYL